MQNYKTDFAGIIKEYDCVSQGRAGQGRGQDRRMEYKGRSLQEEGMRTSTREMGRCYHESQKEVASRTYRQQKPEAQIFVCPGC